MVMLHIKSLGIMKCSNMVSKCFAHRTPPFPPTLDDGVKIQLFQNMVVLHIKFIGITKCSNLVENILPDTLPTDPPHPGDGVNRSKSTILEHGHVAYQINGNHKMHQHGSKCFARRTPLPHYRLTLGIGFNRSKFNFFRKWSCCTSY